MSLVTSNKKIPKQPECNIGTAGMRINTKVPRKPKLTEEERRLFEAKIIRKKREPEFIRQESWRYVRINENWRKPKGIDSKMRLKVKGWPKSPRIGYGSPRKTRGIHPSGFREVLISNVSQLPDIDPEREAVRIARTVGKRKKIEILRKADELGIKVLNRRL